MIPTISPLSAPLGGANVDVPSPPGFREAVLPISGVYVSPQPTREKAYGKTTSQKAGLRYEAKAQEWLRGCFHNFRPNPRLHFYSCDSFRVCVPDGIVVYDDRILVFEIKFQHMPEAWWQLVKLYRPVLEAYKPVPVVTVEVCRSYDPAQPFPEHVVLINPDSLMELRKMDIGKAAASFWVVKWKNS